MSALQDLDHIKRLLEQEAWEEVPKVLKSRDELIITHLKTPEENAIRRAFLESLQRENDSLIAMVSAKQAECAQRLIELERRGEMVSAYQQSAP